MRPEDDRNPIDTCVWYIEARPFNRVAGEPGAIPEGEAVMGSGVVVLLEKLEPVGEGSARRWVPKHQADYKKYLLTCAHVVRGFAPGAQGWNAPLGEILCWRPGAHYSRWQFRDRPRKSGESSEIGAYQARVVQGPLTSPGAVDGLRAIVNNDWVLLEVEDFPGAPPFASAPSAEFWGDFGSAGLRPLSVIGYPGGATNWNHLDAVTPHSSNEFGLKRISVTGEVWLTGPEQTEPGMSGGAVSDSRGALVGIHRAAAKASREYQPVRADHIREWLRERGFRPAPKPAVDEESGQSLNIPETPRPEPEREGSKTESGNRVLLGVFAGLTLLAGLAVWQWWPQTPARTTVCFNVQGGEERVESVYLKAVAGLKLHLLGQGWKMDALPSETDAAGNACFNVAVDRATIMQRTLPFQVQCENAPGLLRGLDPLIVEPYGITRNQLKKSSADLHLFLGRNDVPPLRLSVYSESKWLAAQLSERAAEGSTNSIEKASRDLGLTDGQQGESLKAWTAVLRAERPVVPVENLPKADEVRKVSASAGVFYVGDDRRATGFVVSRNAVLVPAYALTDDSKGYSIAFVDRLTDAKMHRVPLGRVLWQSPQGAPVREGVALLEARGTLPPPLQLSSSTAIEIGRGREIYVIGYPAQDQRTPPALVSLFTNDVRTAMFGKTIPLERDSPMRIGHDATTVGGTSGGPLVDRETNAVVGVHTSGQFKGSLNKVNEAVSVGALLRDPGFRAAVLIRGGVSASDPPKPPILLSQSDPDPLALSSAHPRVAGYDPAFLGMTIPMPIVATSLPVKALDYLHYTVVMGEGQKAARLAAVNFDRQMLLKVERTPDQWIVDPRRSAAHQLNDALFAANRIDRATLVRRSSVTWGAPDVAKLASLGVFYWPNATPQLDVFNRKVWQAVETNVYDKLHAEAPRVSVFTGPIDDQKDVEYRGERIPRRYWMIAFYADPGRPGIPKVHAFLADQYAAGAGGADPDGWGKPKDAEAVTVREIERLTGMRFTYPGKQ